MSELPTPEQPEVEYKSKVNPMLARLPDYVKDPKNYLTIEKALLETLSCGKAHSDPIKMSECLQCTDNMKTRRELMRKFGFTSPAIYMAWKQIHQEIKKRIPLEKYNHMIHGGD